MVAAEDPECRLAHTRAHRARTGERVRAPVELRERQRAELVDQTVLAPCRSRRDRDRAAELTEAVDRAQDPIGARRRLDPSIPARKAYAAERARARRGARAMWRRQQRAAPGHQGKRSYGRVKMCRLFGMSGGAQAGARDLLAARGARLRWRAEPPRARRHRVGCYDADGQPDVFKQPLAAYEDQAFARAGARAQSRTFVAHIRYASTGAIAPQNTHPFEQHGRLFAHNGVIEDLAALERELGDDMRLVARRHRLRALLRADHDARSSGPGDVGEGIVGAARGWPRNLPVFALEHRAGHPRRAVGAALSRTCTSCRCSSARRAAPPATAISSTPARAARSASASGDLASPPAVVVASERMDEDPGWRALASGRAAARRRAPAHDDHRGARPPAGPSADARGPDRQGGGSQAATAVAECLTRASAPRMPPGPPLPARGPDRRVHARRAALPRRVPSPLRRRGHVRDAVRQPVRDGV